MRVREGDPEGEAVALTAAVMEAVALGVRDPQVWLLGVSDSVAEAGESEGVKEEDGVMVCVGVNVALADDVEVGGRAVGLPRQYPPGIQSKSEGIKNARKKYKTEKFGRQKYFLKDCKDYLLCHV